MTTAREVISDVAHHYGLSLSDMQSPRRGRKYAWPRQEAMFEAYTRCKYLSLPALGTILNRDHTTILSGIRAHCQRVGIDYLTHRRVRPVLRGQSHLSSLRYQPADADQYRMAARL